MKATLNKST